MGLIAGLMGGSLAMPGPVPAAWMSARGFGKDTIRATLLVMFVVAYSIALALQLIFSDVTSDTLKITANLALPTIAGLPLGHILAARVSESSFRWLLISMLAFTALFLLASLA